MSATALKEKAMDYLNTMDDDRAQMVIAYMETLGASAKSEQKRSLADIKGKIQFADGYDYKAMRSDE